MATSNLSKMSSSFRRLILQQTAARSTALTSTAAAATATSLTGKPAADHFPAVVVGSEAKQSPSDGYNSFNNVSDMRVVGKMINWPFFLEDCNKQVFLRSSPNTGGRDEDDESSQDDLDGVDDLDDCFDGDDFDSDTDDFEDEVDDDEEYVEEEKKKRT